MREPFTIVVLSDVQLYWDTRLKLATKWGNEDLWRYFFEKTEWGRDNQERLNIAFLCTKETSCRVARTTGVVA